MDDEKDLIIGDEIRLYGDVGDPWGWGDGFTVEQVAMALANIGPGPVSVRINSGGGSAFDGIAIYSMLKAHAGDVTVVIDGLAASAASLIAMAGKRIEMRDGAMMMIHDASGMTFGNSAEHQRTADVLDKLSTQYAGIYARRANSTMAAARSLMQAETWLAADDAIAAGLADGKIAETAATAAAFNYRAYAHAPAKVLARSRPPKTVPNASPKAKQENTMTPEEIRAAQEAADKQKFESAVAAEVAARLAKADADAKAKADAEAAARDAGASKPWAGRFFGLVEKSNFPIADANTLFNASATFEAAKDGLIDALAAAQLGNVPGGNRSQIQFGADARDKFVAGATAAFLAKEGMGPHDPRNEFNGIGPMDLARACAQRAGIRAHGNPMQWLAAVITQGSSDFPIITSNIAEKSLLKGYEEADETFEMWTAVGSLPDFKQARRLDLNALPSIGPVAEHQEFKYIYAGERGELYSISTYGARFSLSRQAVVNDDASVFTRVPQRIGRATKRTVGDLVYSTLLSNPPMGDNVALFHTNHKNIATGGGSALSATSLQAADLAMGVQKDRSQAAVTLGIRPKHLIVPRALKYSASQILRSTAQIGQNNAGVTNPVQNLVDSVVSEARLDAASLTGWYLAADQGQTDTFEVLYLNGDKNPFLEQKLGWEVDGMEWKVRLDFGVKAFAWEGMYYAAGA